MFEDFKQYCLTTFEIKIKDAKSDNPDTFKKLFNDCPKQKDYPNCDGCPSYNYCW